MDEGARRWLLKTVHKNHWRVARWMDPDDLVQEGLECYVETLARYPLAKTASHKMSLFKLVFMSRLTDLANRRTREVPEMCESDLGAPDADRAFSLDGLASPDDFALAAVAAARAPRRVREVISLFATPEGLSALRSLSRARRSCLATGKRPPRESLNDRLCRLLGYDPAEVNLVDEVRQYLSA